MNILRKLFPNINWVSKSVEQDIQIDSWNYGVFIIQFAERFIKSEMSINLENHNSKREAIKDMIYRYGDPLTDVCLHCGHDTTKCYRKLCCTVCFRHVCRPCRKHYINNGNLSQFISKLCEK